MLVCADGKLLYHNQVVRQLVLQTHWETDGASETHNCAKLPRLELVPGLRYYRNNQFAAVRQP
jgi:hypothetical protein